MPTVLHIGCGFSDLPEWLDGYSEVRLDIDPECKPDILASMTELGNIGPYDAIYCCHALEHLYPHEVQKALTGFRKVLVHGGFAACFVPDLEDVRPTNEVLYDSPAGPITGLDMFYGLRSALAEGRAYMAHHTGFTRKTLGAALIEAGFSRIEVKQFRDYNLMGIGVK